MSLDDFPRHRGMPDGRHRYCRDCMSVRQRENYLRRQERKGKRVRVTEVLAEGLMRCKDCGEVKPFEEFPRNKNARNGRHPYCKPCHNMRSEETRQRLYGGGRHYHLVRRYGISAADVERMIAEQGGVCAVCQEQPAEHVDHDHETGEIRGLLCFNCNGGLGQFKDRVDILLAAIQYLDRSRGQTWETTSAWVPSPRHSPQQGPAASATS